MMARGHLAGSALNVAEPSPPTVIQPSCNHGQGVPCYVCERFERERVIRDAIQRRWVEIVSDSGIDGTAKCVHGHMYSEWYCDVCRLGPVDPGYNPNECAREINIALSGTIRK